MSSSLVAPIAVKTRFRVCVLRPARRAILVVMVMRMRSRSKVDRPERRQPLLCRVLLLFRVAAVLDFLECTAATAVVVERAESRLVALELG